MKNLKFIFLPASKIDSQTIVRWGNRFITIIASNPLFDGKLIQMTILREGKLDMMTVSKDILMASIKKIEHQLFP